MATEAAVNKFVCMEICTYVYVSCSSAIRVAANSCMCADCVCMYVCVCVYVLVVCLLGGCEHACIVVHVHVCIYACLT